MRLLRELDQVSRTQFGKDMHAFAAELFPMCRSITGDGLRKTLSLIKNRIPLQMCEVATGTPVFDWTVPKEWNIRGAYIADLSGNRIVDFLESNLHVMNYSTPVHATMPLCEIKPHLFTLPEHPDWIPYRTSYYNEAWGFCLSHNQMLTLADGEYEVCIDSSLEDGHLTYGEYFLPGHTANEVLVSCHACHPSLANDNLSGLSVATFLAQLLSKQKLHYSYRFLFIPGTIGAITWLAQNQASVGKIRHGLVLTCVGDNGQFHYKKSRQGTAEVDRAAQHVLSHLTECSEIMEFAPHGYDERQYCSPGFNLAVGCLMRTPHGRFPEYHTSADNLTFVDSAALADTFSRCIAIFDILENNRTYLNQNPKCEPQLGKRGLYGAMGGSHPKQLEFAMLWVLNLSDSSSTLLDIAEKSGLEFAVIAEAAQLLLRHHLLVERQA